MRRQCRNHLAGRTLVERSRLTEACFAAGCAFFDGSVIGEQCPDCPDCPNEPQLNSTAPSRCKRHSLDTLVSCDKWIPCFAKIRRGIATATDWEFGTLGAGGFVASIIAVVAGAILDYAVTASPDQHGFNVNRVGVILTMVGKCYASR